MSRHRIFLFTSLSSLLILLLALSGQVVAFDSWPDTGQEKCYNNIEEITCPTSGPFLGQDAQYTGLPRVYTKLDGNGNDLPDSATSWVMVRDEITGLIWEVKTDTNKDDVYSWTQGINYANNLVLGGKSDWRLPTIRELSSLTHAGYNTPSIDENYFPNTVKDDLLNVMTSKYWSATTDVSDTDYAWYVRFKLGNVYNGQRDSLDLDKSSLFHVRAVRGQSADHTDVTGNRFEDLGSIIKDHATGLEWQKANTDADINNNGHTTWQEALQYCEALNLDGGGWRLPNRKELLALIDYSEHRYATSFPGTFPTLTPASNFVYYWSSTSNDFVPSNDHGWYIDFIHGGMFSLDKEDALGNSYHVRAVRGQQVALTVTVEGSGSVSSQPVGINNCTESCTATLRHGDILTATPASRFVGWSGGGCIGAPNTNTCTVVAGDQAQVTAIFKFPWPAFIPAITGAGIR